MRIARLDLEDVFVPEIWIEFSKRTGIPELARTTRDEFAAADARLAAAS